MPKPIRARPVSAAQVRAYAGKAQEFVDAATDELAAGRFIAACSLAIHTGISAADAVCGARIGQRAAGDDHSQVLVLLGDAGRDGADVERELRRLLPLKTTAEYEPDDVARSTATKAVERATTCVQIARARRELFDLNQSRPPRSHGCVWASHLTHALDLLDVALLCRFDHPLDECQIMNAKIDRRLAIEGR